MRAAYSAPGGRTATSRGRKYGVSQQPAPFEAFPPGRGADSRSAACQADRFYWFATYRAAHHCLIVVRAIISSVRRLALKIATYGVMHLVVAVLVAFVLTRDWRIALAVGFVEPFFQTIAYSIHDRVWHRIERRRMLSGVEETAEAVTARLDLMDAREQSRSHHHHGHSHALPRNLRQIAAKTVSYGVMHFTIAVLVAFVLTRDWRIALAIGTIEPLVQTAFFTLHDRIWARIEARKARKAEDLAAA